MFFLREYPMRAVSGLVLVSLMPMAGASAQAPALSPAVREYVSVDAPIVALTHVRVIDGTGAPSTADQTVVVVGGRIQSIGPASAAQVPAGARIMDLSGHTVIPGLVGLHDHTFLTPGGHVAHLPFSAPRLYLGSGVTTIRTTGSPAPYSDLNLKAAIDRGDVPGPKMLITGPYLNGGLSGNATIDEATHHLRTPEDARRVVAYWAEEGATWFKAYTTITRAELAAAIDEAHRRGLKVTAHLCSVTAREAAALGIDNLEHGFLVNTDYDPEKVPDACPANSRARLADVEINSEPVRATFGDMIAKNVAMTSTLAVMERSVPNRPPLDQRALDALVSDVRAEVLAARVRTAQAPEGSVALALFKKAMAYEVAFVKAGGLLAAGLDPSGGNLPGFGDQRNYELFIEAGFTPGQAVQILSANGARVLGLHDRIGTVTAGKQADLVVIRGDPAVNPADIKNVTLVFKDGVGYDSMKLIASVKGLVGLR